MKNVLLSLVLFLSCFSAYSQTVRAVLVVQ